MTGLRARGAAAEALIVAHYQGMRIAISGTHGTGKSTLAVELARRLGYDVVEEPYYALADEGHPFADVPSADDFEAMLDRAIADLSAIRPPGVVFDRCPADHLSYVAVLRGNEGVSGVSAPVIEVSGDVNDRVEQVLAAVTVG